MLETNKLCCVELSLSKSQRNMFIPVKIEIDVNTTVWEVHSDELLYLVLFSYHQKNSSNLKVSFCVNFRIFFLRFLFLCLHRTDISFMYTMNVVIVMYKHI